MATRTIQVCDVCGRSARKMAMYRSTLIRPQKDEEPVVMLDSGEHLLCEPCGARAAQFHERAFARTPSGAKRLGGDT